MGSDQRFCRDELRLGETSGSALASEDVKTLKELNKAYYFDEIVPVLFEYGFLK